MDIDPISTEVADINLDNYYLDHQFYNTYVYVHKKFKPKSEINETTHDAQTYVDNIQQVTEQKSQQCNMEVNRACLNEKKKIRTNLHDDAIVEQTVKFAKELIPKVIPPSREFSPTPIYYTMKTSKKSGKKLGKLSNSSDGYNLHKKDTAKSFSKHTRERKEEAINSEKDDASHSSQNSTLDEVQTNHSSTFSLSEGTENHQNKIDNNERKRKHNTKDNFVIPETVAAMGTNLSSQAGVKICIMNEIEKNQFCESLKTPIINSVKECLNKFQNSTDTSSYLQHLLQALTYNSQKLDFLVQRLDKIEKYVMDYSDKTTKVIMSPKPILSKASKLEELAEDFDEIKEESSIDEDAYQATNTSRNVMTSQSAVVTTNRRKENSGRGDDVPIHLNATSTDFGIKSERPNRIPARFCWTDTTDNSQN